MNILRCLCLLALATICTSHRALAIDGQEPSCADRRFDCIARVERRLDNGTWAVGGSGVLIRPNQVLTAAHVMDARPDSYFRVIFRRNAAGELGEQVFVAQRVYRLGAPGSAADLGIIELAGPVGFIRPARVDTATSLVPGMQLVRAGYGYALDPADCARQVGAGVLRFAQDAMFRPQCSFCTGDMVGFCCNDMAGNFCVAHPELCHSVCAACAATSQPRRLLGFENDSGGPLLRLPGCADDPDSLIVVLIGITEFSGVRPAAWNRLRQPTWPTMPDFTPACPARGDFNRDGLTNVQDILDYVRLFLDGACIADLDQSGGAPTVQDLFDYLGAFFASAQ